MRGPFHFTLALGGLTFDFGGVSIGVLNNYPFPVGDQYQVLYFVNPTDDNPTGIHPRVWRQAGLTDLKQLQPLSATRDAGSAFLPRASSLFLMPTGGFMSIQSILRNALPPSPASA